MNLFSNITPRFEVRKIDGYWFVWDTLANDKYSLKQISYTTQGAAQDEANALEVSFGNAFRFKTELIDGVPPLRRIDHQNRRLQPKQFQNGKWVVWRVEKNRPATYVSPIEKVPVFDNWHDCNKVALWQEEGNDQILSLFFYTNNIDFIDVTDVERMQ